MKEEKVKLYQEIKENPNLLSKNFWIERGQIRTSIRKPNPIAIINLLKKYIEIAEAIFGKSLYRLSEKRRDFDIRKRDEFKFIGKLPDFCYVCFSSPVIRHHIVPLSCGGLNTKKNLIQLCNSCHSKIHPWL